MPTQQGFCRSITAKILLLLIALLLILTYARYCIAAEATYDGKIGPYEIVRSWIPIGLTRQWPLSDKWPTNQKGIETVYANNNPSSPIYKATVTVNEEGMIIAYTYKIDLEWFMFVYNETDNHFHRWLPNSEYTNWGG